MIKNLLKWLNYHRQYSIHYQINIAFYAELIRLIVMRESVGAKNQEIIKGTKDKQHTEGAKTNKLMEIIVSNGPNILKQQN